MSGLVADRVSLTLGGTRVLDGVSVALARGRVTVVLGPNGAGKSSLLACLANLRSPDTGGVTLDGVLLAGLDRQERGRRIGLLPQAADIHWDVDVVTLVGLGRFARRGRWGDNDADRQAVARAMAVTDVTHFADRGVESLSGGERSRVLLARVLAGEPEWLLADEPLASLDPAHQLDVLDTLRSAAAAGTGVVVVLHDLNQAARIADTLIVLQHGRVIAAGAPADVLTTDVIAAAFGIETHTGHTPDGRRFVIAMGRTQ